MGGGSSCGSRGKEEQVECGGPGGQEEGLHEGSQASCRGSDIIREKQK